MIETTAKEAEESAAQWGRMCARLQKELKDKREEVAALRDMLMRVHGGYVATKDRPQSLTERMIDDVLFTANSGKPEADVIAAASAWRKARNIVEDDPADSDAHDHLASARQRLKQAVKRVESEK